VSQSEPVAFRIQVTEKDEGSNICNYHRVGIRFHDVAGRLAVQLVSIHKIELMLRVGSFKLMIILRPSLATVSIQKDGLITR